MATSTVAPDRAFTYDWRIKNFSYISTRKKDVVECPMFRSSSGKWIVRIKIGLGSVYASAECLSVSLGNDELNDDQNTFFNWEFSFLDTHETPLFSRFVLNKDFEFAFDKDDPTWSDATGPTLEEVFVTKRSEYLSEDTITLRIRLWQSEEDIFDDEDIPDEDEYCSTTSVIGQDRVLMFRNIAKFSNFSLNHGITEYLHFVNLESTCTLSVILEGLLLQSSRVILKLASDMKNLCVSCKISILDVNQKPMKILDEQYRFPDDYDQLVWVLPPFLSRQEILERRTQILDNDSLGLVLDFETIVCPDLGTSYFSPSDLKNSFSEIAKHTLSETNNRIPQETRNHSNSSHQGEDRMDHSKTPKQMDDAVINLANDFLSLYRERTLCDFELRCCDASFPVHKVVLSARSPVYRNIFYNHMETDKSYHDVPDLDGDTVNRMLTFLYGGTLEPDLTWEGAGRLYEAAVKYQIQSLLQQCSFILKSGITISNACDFLLLAAKHGDEESKYFVEEFIFENLGEIIYSRQWSEFQDQNLQLGSSIMQNLLRRLSRKRSRLSSSSYEDNPGTSTQHESCRQLFFG